ncbi:hypothetical protein OOT00_04545 [Desulfobotulus sp. H1]|nr:hypothetical protein [Desulfobotulus pelophilus]
MEPPLIRLQGSPDATISRDLTLTPFTEYPFTVKSIRALRGEDFQFSITPLKDGRPGYLIQTHNTRKEAGRYFDTLVLTIDSPIREELRIRVLGDIRPASEKQP